MKTYLSDNVLVGETNNKTVFWSIVFVLVLNSQKSTSIVVSFTLTSSLEFGLEALEISAVFDNFNETHSS